MVMKAAIAVGLRGSETSGIGEFGRADPSAADTGLQILRDERQHEDHRNRPDDYDGNRDRRVFLLAADRTGDGRRAASSAIFGSSGRGFKLTPLPRRAMRIVNAASRPNGLLFVGTRYQGSAFSDETMTISKPDSAGQDP
jgi:hypothetical protein